MREKGFTRLLILIAIIPILVGISFYIYQNYPGFSFPSSKSQTQSQSADWLTYQNKQHKYSLKYPSDWELVESHTTEDQDIVTISAPKYKFAEGSYTNFWVHISYPENGIDQYGDSKKYFKQQTINGIEAFRFSNVPDYLVDQVLFQSKTGEVISIYFTPFSEDLTKYPQQEKNHRLYEEMIQSFMFIN